MITSTLRLSLLASALFLTCPLVLKAQYGNTPPLHVEGRQVVDPYGNVVNLHGVGAQPNWYWCKEKEKAWGSEYSLSNVKACLNYFVKDFDMLTDASQGAFCNCIRLSADAAWVTDNGTAWDDYDPNKINRTKLKNFTRALFFPMAKNAIDRGMYVVLRPPTVFPYYDTTVGDDYNRMILDCFDIFSQNDSIKKYAGQIMFELGNEPINLWSSWDAKANNGEGKGTWTEHALHDYFQPVVDKIRANGFTGIIWVPGTNYQMNYRDFVNCPVVDDNLGYATHCYPGWYGHGDDRTAADADSYIRSIHDWWPIIDTNPIIVTEIDWSPATNEEGGHYNEEGDWVPANYGTWGTARTSHWGNLYKAMSDHYGNVSMTSLGAYLDNDYYKETGIIRPCYYGVEEGCGYAFFEWFKEWSDKFSPAPEMVRQSTADTRTNRYINPILRTDLPHARVFRVAETYFLVSRRTDRKPAVTLLKSCDLVNWQRCPNPEAQLLQIDPTGQLEAESVLDASFEGFTGGSMVTTPTGEHWAVFNKEDDLLGATVYLEPVTLNGTQWVIGNKGTDVSLGGKDYAKPHTGAAYPALPLTTNDTFTDPYLGSQWQWLTPGQCSLTESGGSLRLYAATDAMLVQPLVGMDAVGVTTEHLTTLYATAALSTVGLQTGDRAGIALQEGYTLAVEATAEGLNVVALIGGTPQNLKIAKTQESIWLRTVVSPSTGKAHFEYSLDNETYALLGADFAIPAHAYNGLFCQAGSQTGGYADIDWFSTEPRYSEERFYKSGQLKPRTTAEATLASLMVKDVEMLPYSTITLPVQARFQSGNTNNVAAQSTYRIDNTQVLGIADGQASALTDEGTTTVTASCTDAVGNTMQTTFRVSVSLFPLSPEGLNPSIYKAGSFSTSTHGLTTGEDGFGGWQYVRPADLSQHRYLVVNLRRAAANSPAFRLYDTDNYFDPCAEVQISNQRTVVIDLENLKKNDGTALNTAAIRMAGFQSKGKTPVYLASVYLSDDGVNPITTSVDGVTPDNLEVGEPAIYSIDGIRLPDIQRGVNILRYPNGVVKKVFVK